MRNSKKTLYNHLDHTINFSEKRRNIILFDEYKIENKADGDDYTANKCNEKVRYERNENEENKTGEEEKTDYNRNPHNV